jgi:hypothetical protein
MEVVSFTPLPFYPAFPHWEGGWMGPKVDLLTVEKRKISCPLLGFEPDSLLIRPAA